MPGPQEVIERFYRLWEGSERTEEIIQEVMGLFDEEIVFCSYGAEGVVPFSKTYYGKQGGLQYMAESHAAHEIKKFELLYLVTSGNRVDAHIYEEARVRATGKTWKAHGIDCWETNDKGKIARFTYRSITYHMAKPYLND